MDIQVISNHWKDVFTAINRNELKLLMLATLNNARRVLLLFGVYMSWILVPIILLGWWVMPENVNQGSLSMDGLLFNGSWAWWIASRTILCMWVVLLFFCCLAARASLERKDVTYFKIYAVRFFYFLVLYYFLGMWAIIPTFFFLDADYNFQTWLYSLLQALIFVFYFLPTVALGWSIWFVVPKISQQIIILGGTPLLAWFGIGKGIVVYWALVTGLVLLIKHIFFISLFSIYYSKIKHAYFQLF